MTWWENFFDHTFAESFLERTDKLALQCEVNFIAKALNLVEGQTLFDQCCGTGDIAIELAKQKINVIGIDQSFDYIESAKRKAQSQGVDIRFDIADARSYVPETLRDAAINWFSSFAYSSDDRDNQLMLINIYRSLKPEGLLLLDYINVHYVEDNFVASEEHVRSTPSGHVSITKQSSIDRHRQMLVSEWTYRLPDNSQYTKSGESRIYYPNELQGMLEQCGFVIETCYGNRDGDSFQENSPRCIFLARKPHD